MSGLGLHRLRVAVGLVLCLGFVSRCVGQAIERPVRAPVRVPESVTLEANIPYDEHADTVLVVMVPKAEAKEKKRPGVIVFHGGGWIQSTKETTMNALCLPFLKEGFVVCNVEYRVARLGASPAPAPAAAVDALKAAKWFVEHADKYGVDVNRVVVTGASAGGHLALMVGMATPEAKLGPVVKVAAVVNGYGPADVADLIERGTGFAVEWLPEQEGRMDLARRLSPMTYVRKELPPILTVQGANDRTVPVEQNVRLTEALKAAGADAELVIVTGAGHGFTTQWPDVHRQVFEFLRKRGVLK
jgi:acetyl esterase/lipase